MLFDVWEDTRVLVHWHHSFDIHLCYLEPVSWVSSGLTIRTGCSLMAARQQVFFPSWVPSGFTSSPSLVSATAIDFDILCLLIWQEIFHFSLATNIGAQETHGRISPNILPSVHFWTTHGHLAGLPCISLSLMPRPCLHIWSRLWIYWGQSPYIICGLHYYPGVSHIVVP